jgi:uncharacterized protein (DUF302 family)
MEVEMDAKEHGNDAKRNKNADSEREEEKEAPETAEGGSGERKVKRGKHNWGMFAAGVLWGIALAFVFGVIYLRSSLIVERKSPFGFRETFAKLWMEAKNTDGWVVKPVSCSLPQPRDGSKVAVMKLCHGKLAARLMDNPSSRDVSAMIPCSFAVYEKDGTTYIARMNVGLLGALLGGNAAMVFQRNVEPDQVRMVESVVKSATKQPVDEKRPTKESQR